MNNLCLLSAKKEKVVALLDVEYCPFIKTWDESGKKRVPINKR